jgi:hypothetical protein
MRLQCRIAVLVLTHALLGCDTRSTGLRLPTAASATPPTVTPSPSLSTSIRPEQWILIGTYMGHTGPATCISPFSGIPVEPISSVLTVQRTGPSIQLSTEHDHYIGSVVADQFSATETADPGGLWNCGAEQRPFRFEGAVTGQFSADGRSLVGEEVALFRLSSVETISRRWHWSATRKE